MLGIAGECELPAGYSQPVNSSCYSVKFKNSREFSFSEPTFRGRVSADAADLIEGILDETSLRLQVTCALNTEEKSLLKTRRFLPQIIPCSLSIIVYGPANLCNDLGDYFQDYDIYLQDPRSCDMDVRYCNPHRLSSVDLSRCPMTSELSLGDVVMDVSRLKEIPAQTDLLAILNSQGELEEAPQPHAISTTLERQVGLND